MGLRYISDDIILPSSELVFKTFLSFSHGMVIVPCILLVGMLWSRDIFFDALCQLLISILLNTALKSFFAIPLSPELGIDGFAFPSGHMQSAVVFYGCLFYKTSNLWIKIILLLLLMGIGLSLMHFGYHNAVDIAGGVFFGCLVLCGYQANQYWARHHKKGHAEMILSLCALALLSMNLIFSVKKMWMAIISCVLVAYFLYKKRILKQ